VCRAASWLCSRGLLRSGQRAFPPFGPAPLQYNLPPPRLRSPLPRIITFQRKRANRRVVNEGELLAVLAEFGEVGGHWVGCVAGSTRVSQMTPKFVHDACAALPW
jgi:hypothetical protein